MVDAGYCIDEELELTIKTKFAYRLLIIQNLADSIRLLDDAVALPQKTTAYRIKTTNDLLLDGEFNQTGSSTLIRGFSITTREPKILKFTPDASKEYKIFQQLGLDAQQSIANHLVPIEQLIEDIHGKTAVVMPMFLCTIDLLPALPEENLWAGYQEIMIAVRRLHESSIVHNDIKPGNILMDTFGRWYLCDYGSCSRIADRSHNIRFTTMYIPTGFKERRTVRFDYLLVIVTILDRFTGGEFCRNEFTMNNVNDQILIFTHNELKENLMNLWNQYFAHNK